MILANFWIDNNHLAAGQRGIAGERTDGDAAEADVNGPLPVLRQDTSHVAANSVLAPNNSERFLALEGEHSKIGHCPDLSIKVLAETDKKALIKI